MPRHPRRSPRLPAYDYREPAFYFITVNTHLGRQIFGRVEQETMILSPLGWCAHREWEYGLARRTYVEPDTFVVMPNHVHLLFGLGTADDADYIETADALKEKSPKRFQNQGAHSVSSIVGVYKAAITRQARRMGLWKHETLWQGRFHDRVVRNDRERAAIHEYIRDNPRRWHEDRCHRRP